MKILEAMKTGGFNDTTMVRVRSVSTQTVPDGATQLDDAAPTLDWTDQRLYTPFVPPMPDEIKTEEPVEGTTTQNGAQ